MIFRDTPIAGAFVVAPEKHVDDRGFFTRTWCAREFTKHGLDPAYVQSSLSVNTRKGTLRGLHYSVAPHAETKVVRCVRGSIYDVIVDLRAESPTFRRWFAETLSADNALAIYIPTGIAHGFQTLEDGSDVLYQMSEFYDPDCARGVRWDDPAFGIRWPSIAAPATRLLSSRDAAYPNVDGPLR